MINYKYNVGDKIKDNKRDIVIINRKYFKKEIGGGGFKKYKYRCNKCGYECGVSYKDGEFQSEYWINEYHLSKGVGCTCCQGRAVVQGINDIKTTNPNILKYFKNQIDTIKYTSHSKKRVICVCPECNASKNVQIDNLTTQGFSCPKCSDGMSFGEKVIYNLLLFYKIDFIKELSRKDFKWCKNYRYDFYIRSINTILEVNGKQHSEESGFEQMGGRSLSEEIENDINKRKLATQNKVSNYICLDYKEETFNDLKNSICNSKLLELLKLKDIDWDYIYEQSLKSIVILVCDYRKKYNYKVLELSKLFKLSMPTITKYLKIGNELGLCDYNAKEELKNKRNIYINDSVNTATPIKCIENNTYFKSIGLCVRLSGEVYGIKLNDCTIRNVVNGRFKQHRGYRFCNVSKEEFNKAINEGLSCYGSSFIL